MPRKSWLVLTFLLVVAGSVGADYPQTEAAGEVLDISCDLVVVQVDKMMDIPRLPFLFLTGAKDWKLQSHGLSPLQRPLPKSVRSKRHQTAMITQEFPTRPPTHLWHESSKFNIWLDLFWILVIAWLVVGLVILAVVRRKLLAGVILVLGAALFIALPALVISGLKGSNLFLIVDNSTQDPCRIRIDDRVQIEVGPLSQSLLALKEGRRQVDLLESGGFRHTRCFLEAKILRDASGKAREGFYVFNVQSHNQYTVQWR